MAGAVPREDQTEGAALRGQSGRPQLSVPMLEGLSKLREVPAAHHEHCSAQPRPSVLPSLSIPSSQRWMSLTGTLQRENNPATPRSTPLLTPWDVCAGNFKEAATLLSPGRSSVLSPSAGNVSSPSHLPSLGTALFNGHRQGGETWCNTWS